MNDTFKQEYPFMRITNEKEYTKSVSYFNTQILYYHNDTYKYVDLKIRYSTMEVYGVSDKYKEKLVASDQDKSDEYEVGATCHFEINAVDRDGQKIGECVTLLSEIWDECINVYMRENNLKCNSFPPVKKTYYDKKEKKEVPIKNPVCRIKLKTDVQDQIALTKGIDQSFTSNVTVYCLDGTSLTHIYKKSNPGLKTLFRSNIKKYLCYKGIASGIIDFNTSKSIIGLACACSNGYMVFKQVSLMNDPGVEFNIKLDLNDEMSQPITVPVEDYDKLLKDHDTLKIKYDTLLMDFNSIKLKYETLLKSGNMNSNNIHDELQIPDHFMDDDFVENE
jgi:hypothetical protein